MPVHEKLWQDIAWGGVSLQLPADWQPSIIHKSYLFFEHEGNPAFAIRWEKIRGSFSAEKILHRMRKSFKHGSAALEQWDRQDELQEKYNKFSITAYTWHDDGGKGKGLLLYCSDCSRATLIQLYEKDSREKGIVDHILATYCDHPSGPEQEWSMFDIRALMPVDAELQSHEFLAGRYTLSFLLNSSTLTLYRFKPSAAILLHQSIREFGSSLADGAPLVEKGSDEEAYWEFRASGLQKLAVRLRRKPGWIWLKLKELKEHNAILAVKASGKDKMDEKIVEHITDHFVIRKYS